MTQMEIAYNEIKTRYRRSELDQNYLTNRFTPRKFAYKITPTHKNIYYLLIQMIL